MGLLYKRNKILSGQIKHKPVCAKNEDNSETNTLDEQKVTWRQYVKKLYNNERTYARNL